MSRLDDDSEEIIGLAWHQGLTRQKSMNTFQVFAARYQIRRMRERFVKDVEDTLERSTYYLNQPRHEELFPDKYESPFEALTLAVRPVEEVVEDLDEYDRYFAELEEKRHMTGGEVIASDDDERWAWQ